MLGRSPALLCALSILVLFDPLFAQTETGAVVGTVLDASDAPIPRAPVSIRNSETGATVNLTTDDAGSYTSPPLRTGFYLISVEVPGFRKTSKTISLDVNQRARVNFKMEVGQVSESVTIAAESPILETQSAAAPAWRRTARNWPILSYG